MTATLQQLGIDDDASHAAIAEHVYQFLRRHSPSRYPEAWSHAPEPLRTAITLAVITGADHAAARITASLTNRLDQVSHR